MKEFDELLAVAERLLGPHGCPWDQKQTFSSLQAYVLEEAHEVIEAVDHEDDEKIIEELGDLLYTIVFYAKLGELQGRFQIEEIVNAIKEKLVRRHPHVFADVKVSGADEVLHNWEQIKQTEKSGSKRESALDGIPPTLPTLMKAQKMIKKMRKAQFPEVSSSSASTTENEAAAALFSLLLQCDVAGIDLEAGLRQHLKAYETQFRDWEKAQKANTSESV